MSGYTPLTGPLPCVCVMCDDVCMTDGPLIGSCRDCREAEDRQGKCHGTWAQRHGWAEGSIRDDWNPWSEAADTDRAGGRG